ncbi:Armadillo repeat-containing protein 10 [Gryllus bimaculatus]|nr:Armadillo repeat-containing protein 10 [Gryllus bimaculatus]
MASSTGDKTVNKVALCSAIFAGFAYVGYSVVRTAFCRKLGRKDGEGTVEILKFESIIINGKRVLYLLPVIYLPAHQTFKFGASYPDEHRLYFRRLSQTTQTDVLLGNLDMTGSGKVILRPLTVQERIRELNLRARMFTDTMLAIQGGSSSPRHSPLPGPRSLQCSPWSSPRILSPVDVRHILASRSTENLSTLAAHGELVGSPVRRRWTRRSVRRSGLAKHRSPEGLRESEEEARKEAERLLRDGEDELRLRLETLTHRDRVITAHEAKSLVALLHSSDEVLLERTLTTIGNCGTFTANQDTLREAGCLLRLQNLLTYPKTSIQLAAIRALGNLSLNQENQKELKDVIPILLTFVNKEQPSDKLVQSALLTLTNIAVLPDWHDEFYPVLHTLYNLVDAATPQIKLQALKLLVNLSCNEDMVPSLLAAQAPRRLIYLLDPSTNEEILLRVVTLLANLTTAAKDQNLDPTIDLPAEDKAASPDTIRYAAIYGVNTLEKMRSKIFVLMNQHKNEDIRVQALNQEELKKNWGKYYVLFENITH